jgi:hypothetical protein
LGDAALKEMLWKSGSACAAPATSFQTLNNSMTKSDEAKSRQHRLAAKLRENLRRRKVQPENDEQAKPASPAPPVRRPEKG